MFANGGPGEGVGEAVAVATGFGGSGEGGSGEATGFAATTDAASSAEKINVDISYSKCTEAFNAGASDALRSVER
jgi:hypothetical protein